MFYEQLFGYFQDWWKELAILIVTSIFFIYAYLKYAFLYWYRRGFEHDKGTIPFGSLTDFVLTKKCLGETLKEVYQIGKGNQYFGYYSLWSPTLMIRDPELIKWVLVKDFEHFFDRGVYYNEKDDPLSANLFSMTNARWKTIRCKLSPAFATGRIKVIYETMKICALHLNDYVSEQLDKGISVIDMNHLIARHSINLIARTAIGLEDHNLRDESELSKIAQKVTEPNIIQDFRCSLALISKDFAKRLRIRLTPKEVENYFLEVTKNVVEHRIEDRVVRKDFMDSLINLWDRTVSFEKMSTDDESTISLRDIAGVMFNFILAAYESTSSVVCFCLYELAKNPDVREKVLKEIDAAGSPEDMTYEKLSTLTYLEMVMSETWRKYPAAPVLFRECQKDYTLPDGRILKKGVAVTISVSGLQSDPKYYPEPEKFNPERFNKQSPSQTVHPFTYLPFGEGPRFCIGKRYGIIQTKMTLFSLLFKFKIDMDKVTPKEISLEPKVFVTHAQGGMPLNVSRR